MRNYLFFKYLFVLLNYSFGFLVYQFFGKYF